MEPQPQPREPREEGVGRHAASRLERRHRLLERLERRRKLPGLGLPRRTAAGGVDGGADRRVRRRGAPRAAPTARRAPACAAAAAATTTHAAAAGAEGAPVFDRLLRRRRVGGRRRVDVGALDAGVVVGVALERHRRVVEAEEGALVEGVLEAAAVEVRHPDGAVAVAVRAARVEHHRRLVPELAARHLRLRPVPVEVAHAAPPAPNRTSTRPSSCVSPSASRIDSSFGSGRRGGGGGAGAGDRRRRRRRRALGLGRRRKRLLIGRRRRRRRARGDAVDGADAAAEAADVGAHLRPRRLLGGLEALGVQLLIVLLGHLREAAVVLLGEVHRLHRLPRVELRPPVLPQVLDRVELAQVVAERDAVRREDLLALVERDVVGVVLLVKGVVGVDDDGARVARARVRVLARRGVVEARTHRAVLHAVAAAAVVRRPHHPWSEQQVLLYGSSGLQIDGSEPSIARMSGPHVPSRRHGCCSLCSTQPGVPRGAQSPVSRQRVRPSGCHRRSPAASAVGRHGSVAAPPVLAPREGACGRARTRRHRVRGGPLRRRDDARARARDALLGSCLRSASGVVPRKRSA